MDVNGSRFHLIQGARDWRPVLRAQAVAASPGERALYWDDAFPGISLAPRLFRFPARQGESPLNLGQRRGAACDRFGNLYWIGDDQESIQWSPNGGESEGAYWSSERLQTTDACHADSTDFAPCAPVSSPATTQLRGLAVTTHHYLVVGTLEPAGLLIFDLHAGGVPRWRRWPEPIRFAPFDFAAIADGGLWLLDRGPAAGEARYWRLDRYFSVVPGAGDPEFELLAQRQSNFKPVDGDARDFSAHSFPLGHALHTGSPLEIAEPVAIETLPDGSILILESDPAADASVLHRYRDGIRTETISLSGERLAGLEPPRVMAHDLAYVDGEVSTTGVMTGDLYLVTGEGNQAVVLTLAIRQGVLGLSLKPRFLPLRRYDGKDLIVSGQDVLYHLPQLWVPLVEQPRPSYATEALLELPPFDGREPGCVWHRLVLDACIVSGDRITIESRAADREDELDAGDWLAEPDLYARATAELPYYRPFSMQQAQRAGTGHWELLFQQARGRYLQLRLRLQGSGRSTPRLRAMRVWYPRFSYLAQYLPAVYREEAESASFLERYLANPEGLLTTLEGAIADSQLLFDDRTAPSEYLEWLAGWFGATLDPDWDEGRRRLFIQHADLLFRWRGTPAGLMAMIRLRIDLCPDASLFDDLRLAREPGVGRYGARSVRLVEHYQRRRFPGVALGDPRQLEQPGILIEGAEFEPSQGPEPIHRRFRDFLRCRYAEDENAIAATWGQAIDALSFPTLVPTDGSRAGDWHAFTAHGIGFTYAAVDPGDTPLFRAFLTRRYRLVETLRTAWGWPDDGSLSDFQDVTLPSALPTNLTQLADWIGFVSLTLPTERNAHRFTVLVPSDPAESAAHRERRVAQVQGVVERERPAHTEFDVQPFWALFQVGGARLGLDTALGEGSRFIALVLGKSALAEGFLVPAHPWSACDRDGRVLGRDVLVEKRQ